jgi:hypothetical protein
MSIVAFDEEYNGKRVRAEIDVVQAGALAGIARTRLGMEAGPYPLGEIEKDEGGKIVKVIKPPTGEEIDRYWLRRYVYPDCIAAAYPVRDLGAVVMGGGWVEIDGIRCELPDLSFETFENIPFLFLIRWEQETYKQNPSWLPGAEETQKKVSANGSPGSKPSTTHHRRRKAKTASQSSPTLTT